MAADDDHSATGAGEGGNDVTHRDFAGWCFGDEGVFRDLALQFLELRKDEGLRLGDGFRAGWPFAEADGFFGEVEGALSAEVGGHGGGESEGKEEDGL